MYEDLNYVEAARTGHIEMLHVIFGGPEAVDNIAPAQSETKAAAPAKLPDKSPIQLTPEIFDRLFGDQGGGSHA